ncbi:MAG TPA: hypothetical protein VFY87_31785, partial [Geminicoccaceae bacterium]|nr:hypothetical protein [Geminicoccaceae bacterium]
AFLQAALGKPAAAARPLLRLASADTEDAVAVLTGGPQQLYAGSATQIRSALALERAAARVPAVRGRDRLLRRAIELKQQARASMLNP